MSLLDWSAYIYIYMYSVWAVWALGWTLCIHFKWSIVYVYKKRKKFERKQLTKDIERNVKGSEWEFPFKKSSYSICRPIVHIDNTTRHLFSGTVPFIVINILLLAWSRCISKRYHIHCNMEFFIFTFQVDAFQTVRCWS